MGLPEICSRRSNFDRFGKLLSTIHQRFLKSLQNYNWKVEGEPKQFLLGQGAGSGVWGVEKGIYNGTNLIAFLPRKEGSGRAGGWRFRAGMRIFWMSRKATLRSGISFLKAE